MKRIAVSSAIVALVAASFLTPAAGALAASAEPCSTYEVISARGTSAPPQGSHLTESDYKNDPLAGKGPEGDDVEKRLRQQLKNVIDPTTNTKVSVRGWALRYPAGDLTPLFVDPETDGHKPDNSYTQGMKQGAKSLVDRISARHAACGDMRFVLSGYSQGTDALAHGLAKLTAAQKHLIVAMVSFGDPFFNNSDTVADRGTYYTDHYGTFGKRAKWSKLIDAPVFSYCRKGDIACNLDVSAPNPYSPTGLPFLATEDFKVLGMNPPFDPLHIHSSYYLTSVPNQAADDVAGVLNPNCAPATGAKPPHLVISGPSSIYAGEKAQFNTTGSRINPCLALNWTWSVPVIVANALKVTPLAAGGTVGTPAQESRVDVPPSSSKPRFSPTFDSPGSYPVEASLNTVEFGQQSVQTQVNVLPVPTVAPGSPQAAFVRTGDLLTMRWTQPGEAAEYYVLRNSAGDVVAAAKLLPLDAATPSLFEWKLNLPQDVYTLDAVNHAGQTSATAVWPADAAHYQFNLDGTATGDTLTLSGTRTEAFDQLLAAHPSNAPIVTGNYSATFTPDSGAPVAISMTDADATLDWDATTWTFTWRFHGADATTMRGGLAAAWLAGGSLDLQVDGNPVRIVDASTTESTHDDPYVIDPNATVPEGATADEFWGSVADHSLNLAHTGSYSTATFPAWGEKDAGFPWTSGTTSDVHTFIGTSEVSNSAHVVLQQLGAPDSTDEDNIVAGISGLIGDGSTDTMRKFIQSGTISFRVDGGAVNVLTVHGTLAQAEDAFPTPTAPVIEDQVIYADLYRTVQWTPVISWGVDGSGSYSISVPSGIVGVANGENSGYIDEIYGQPGHTGTYPVVVTASNATGTTTRTFDLVVNPGSADDRYYITGAARLWRQSDGSFDFYEGRLDWVNADNPNMEEWVPAVHESGIAEHVPDWYVTTTFTAVDPHIYKPDGTEVAFTGTLNVLLRHSLSGDGEVRLTSTDLRFPDNSTDAVNQLWKSALEFTFKMSEGGSVNRVWHAGYFPDVDRTGATG